MSTENLVDVSWPEALIQIRAAVNGKKREWQPLCKKAHVGYHWLRRFAEGISKSPDAHRVSRVAVALGLPIRFQIPREPVAAPQGRAGRAPAGSARMGVAGKSA